MRGTKQEKLGLKILSELSLKFVTLVSCTHFSSKISCVRYISMQNVREGLETFHSQDVVAFKVPLPNFRTGSF